MIHLTDIRKAYNRKGYSFFEKDDKSFNLNYGGIRTSGGEWNDIFFLIWVYKGNWNHLQWVGTTDPGKTYLQSPLSVEGTAILPEGQHKGLFKLGKHKGVYEALVQARTVKIYRDNNKDVLIDTDSILDDDWHGINSHRAHDKFEVQNVGKYSAGCQVTLNISEFEIFMYICKQSFKHWNSALTYTLFNINDFK